MHELILTINLFGFYKVFLNIALLDFLRTGQTAYQFPATNIDTLAATTNGTLNGIQPAAGQAIYQYNATFGRGQPPTYQYGFIGNPTTYGTRTYLPVAGGATSTIEHTSSYQLTKLSNVIAQNNHVVSGLPEAINAGRWDLCRG